MAVLVILKYLQTLQTAASGLTSKYFIISLCLTGTIFVHLQKKLKNKIKYGTQMNIRCVAGVYFQPWSLVRLLNTGLNNR